MNRGGLWVTSNPFSGVLALGEGSGGASSSAGFRPTIVVQINCINIKNRDIEQRNFKKYRLWLYEYKRSILKKQINNNKMCKKN